MFNGLNQSWLDAAYLKRRANYSPVLVFETTDPKRLEQLKRYLFSLPERSPVFVYDPWDGLGRMTETSAGGLTVEPHRRTRRPTSYLQQASGTDEAQALVQFKAALREADHLLKGSRSTLVIQNVAENREWESGLQAALRAWTVDPTLLSRGSTVVLVTADASQVLDSYTRDLVVIQDVDPSDRDERRHIIAHTAGELGFEVAPERLEELVLATAGLNLHQVESVLLESYFRHHEFQPAAVRDLKSELVRKSGILEVEEPSTGFADIGGYEAIKSFIRKFVVGVLRNPERARRFALPLPRGILFFGPPGTGKSLFASALASEIHLPFIHLITENIYSKWLGESGQNLRTALRLADKMSPAIVFVDEIDRFGKRTASAVGGGAGEETKRVFSQFLEWLGKPDREAIVIGTTNVPDQLDEAFLRTGRFDYKIPFLYPGHRARLEILLVHLGLAPGSRHPRAPLAEPLEAVRAFLEAELVPRTAAFSCAELEELVTRAKRQAFDRDGLAVERQDFLKAAASFRVDRDSRLRTVEICLRQAQQFTDDQSFLDAVREEMGANG